MTAFLILNIVSATEFTLMPCTAHIMSRIVIFCSVSQINERSGFDQASSANSPVGGRATEAHIIGNNINIHSEIRHTEYTFTSVLVRDGIEHITANTNTCLCTILIESSIEFVIIGILWIKYIMVKTWVGEKRGGGSVGRDEGLVKKGRLHEIGRDSLSCGTESRRSARFW